jgi:hypothetical protein
MAFGNIFVGVLLTFYLLKVVKLLLFKKDREVIQKQNNELEKLRANPVKTLEEQKKFIDVKYGKSQKWKFSWQKLFILLGNIIIFIIVFRTMLYGFSYYNIDIKLWQAIVFAILFPMIMNIVLAKFNLAGDDLRVYFR